MISPLDTCLTGIDAALTTLLAARRRHRADARIVFAADVRQLVQAYREAEVKDTRAALARVDRDRERAHADLSETARTAAHRLRLADSLRDELTAARKRHGDDETLIACLRESIAELQGQLAVARGGSTSVGMVTATPDVPPLPQGRKSAPEPNSATSATPAPAPRARRTATERRTKGVVSPGKGGSSQAVTEASGGAA